MEKNSHISITAKELEQFRDTGEVPDRIKEVWGYGVHELHEIIISNQYSLLP